MGKNDHQEGCGQIAIFTLTSGGNQLAKNIAPQLKADHFECRGMLRKVVNQAWPQYDALIFIMAAGIVVRTLAPLLGDKRSDPAVVVMDEQGRYAISLLSGHLGGANELARRLAALTHGQAVITTASDVLERTPLDLWARELGLVTTDPAAMTRAMGTLVNNGSVNVFSDYTLPEVPADFVITSDPGAADMVISCRSSAPAGTLLLHPRILVVGIGCNRGTAASRIEEAVRGTLAQHGLAMAAVSRIATIDLKADEQGLLEFAHKKGYGVDFFHRDRLNEVKNVTRSQVVMRAVGAQGVAEPAAILGAGHGKLVVRKEKWTDVTVAVAEAAWP